MLRWLPQPLALLRESRVPRNVLLFSGTGAVELGMMLRWLPQPLTFLRESRVSRNVVPFSGRPRWRGGVVEL